MRAAEFVKVRNEKSLEKFSIKKEQKRFCANLHTKKRAKSAKRKVTQKVRYKKGLVSGHF